MNIHIAALADPGLAASLWRLDNLASGDVRHTPEVQQIILEETKSIMSYTRYYGDIERQGQEMK